MLTLLAITLIFCLCVGIAYANPEGGVVSSGAASITSDGPDKLVIEQSTDRAVIDWKSFDIQVRQHTHFTQPTTNSVTLNRVNSDYASHIDGKLTSNGNLIIVNPNGMVFGPNSVVDVGGLIASSANILNDDFMKAGNLKFNLPGYKNASIINEGKITVRDSGVLGFVAPHVENAGSIKGKLSKVTLSSGDRFTLDMYGDKLIELDVTDQLESQSLRMGGTIENQGGIIELSAAKARGAIDSVIDVSGKMIATSIEEKDGKIILLGRNEDIPSQGYEKDIEQFGRDVLTISGEINVSSDTGVGGKIIAIARETLIDEGANLSADGLSAGGEINVGGAYQGAQTLPSGMYSYVAKSANLSASGTIGDGGKVIVWANKNLVYSGDAKAEGGPQGRGGLVETSGEVFQINGLASVKGGLGAGVWLLDPNNITITGATANMSAGPAFTSTDDTATLDVSSITTAMNAGTSVTVSTASAGTNAQSGDITISTNIAMGAVPSTPTLTLQAHNSIINSGGFDITSTSGSFNVILNSDSDASGAGAIVLGSGTIINTAGGNITLGGGATPSTGHAVGTATNIYGVELNNTQLLANGGNIIINGTGYTSAAASRHGVYIYGGSQITTSGAAGITINGIGGVGTNTNYGIAISNAIIETANGTLGLTGTGGAGTVNDNHGIYIENASSAVRSTGTGAVNLTGTGGGGNTTGNNGIVLASGTVSVVNGNLTFSGTGGPGSTNGSNGFGVDLRNSTALVQSTGSGNITFTGVTKGLINNYGVYLRGSSVVKSTSTGNISITGTSNGTSTSNRGIYIISSSSVQSTGSGTITMAATSGTSSGTNDGFVIDAGTISTVSGNISITGTSRGTNAADDGIEISNTSTISSTGSANIILTGTASTGLGIRTLTGTNILGNASDTGTITLKADSMNLAALTITNKSHAYLIRNAAGSMTINDTAGSHIVAATVFSSMAGAGGSLYIGDNTTNTDLTISSEYSYTRPVVFDTNAGTITISAKQSTVASSTGAFKFVDAVSLSSGATSLDTSNSNGNITFDSTLTIPAAAVDRTIASGSGNITLSNTITPNDNYVTFSGTGTLSYGGAYTTSSDKAVSFHIPWSLTSNSSISTGAGNISLRGVTMSTYNLTFAGTGNLYLNGAITSTNVAFPINRSTFLLGDTSINIGTANFSLANTLDMSTYSFKVLDSGDTTISADVTSLGNAGGTKEFSVMARGSILVTTAADIASTSDKLNILLNADYDASGAGAIQIAGTSGAALSILESKGGNITLGGGNAGTGASNAVGTLANPYGVELSYAKLSASGGNISIRGIGYADALDDRYGINITNSSEVKTTNTGTITMNGTGGSGAGLRNYGIYVGGSAYLQSVDGNINLTATSAGTGGSGRGFRSDTATIEATGTGSISMTGTGATAATNANTGLNTQGTGVYVNDGNLTITGTGGGASSTNSRGVAISNSSDVQAKGNGNIIITGTGNGTATNDGVYIITTSNIKAVNGNITITGTSNGTTTNNYGITISATSSVKTTGTGGITMTGTSGTGNGTNDGISLDAATVASVTGNISLTGTSRGANAADDGIEVVNTSTISSTSSANISLIGTASTGVGIRTVTGSNVLGNAADTGTITLTADSMNLADLTLTNTGNIYMVQKTAANTMTLNTAAGSHIVAATVFSGMTTSGSLYLGDAATGALTVSSAYSYQRPVIFNTDGSTITVSAAQSTVAASKGSFLFMDPAVVSANIDTSAASGGTPLIQFDKTLTLSANLTSSNGTTTNGDITITGNLTLPSAATTRTLTTGSGNIYLGSSTASTSTANTNTLAFSGTGTLYLGTAYTSTNKSFTINRTTVVVANSSVNLGTGIFTLSNPLDMGTNAGDSNNTFDFDVNSAGTINIDANIISRGKSDGSKGILLKSSGSILVGSAADIKSDTEDFNITLWADSDANGGAIQIAGTSGAALSVLDSKGGNITLGGGNGGSASAGNAIGNAANPYGVELSYAQLSASGGNISIRGKGYTQASNNMYGVYVSDSSTVKTTGTGTITIDGTGGGSGATSSHYGVVVGSGTTVQTVDGALSITGTGGVGGAGSNVGIVLNSTTVEATGSGAVTISAAAGTTLDSGVGFYMSGSNLKVKNGNLSLTSTSGVAGGILNYAIHLLGSSVIQSSGTGNITMSGTVNAGGASNSGVYITGSSIVKSTSSGNISVTGITNATGTTCSGIIIDSSGSVQSSGTGTITMAGTSGTGAATTYGISMSGASITTVSGDISLTGTSRGSTTTTSNGLNIISTSTIVSSGSANTSLTGIASTGYGILTSTGANVIGNASDTGTITLTADSMNLAALTMTTAGNIYIAQKTAANTMTFNTAAGSHIVAASVFSGMTTSGSLYLGDAATGALTVSSAYSYQRPVIFDTNNATITVSAAQSTVAASKGSFLFMDPAVVSANIDTSAASGGTPFIQFDKTLTLSANLTSSNGTTTNGDITITGNLTLPGTAATRTLTTGSGNIYLGSSTASTSTANTDTLAFSGTGTLYLGTAYTSTNTNLTINRSTVVVANSSVNLGTGIFTLSNPLDMGTNAGDANNTFDFDVNSSGKINIDANITSRGKSDGSKGILLKSSGSILVGSAADIKSDTEDFNITLWADSDANGGAIQIAGTSGAALSVLESKGGSITLGGGSGGSASAGKAIGDATNTYGVELSYAQLTAAGGNITVNGQGYSDAVASRHGVYVRNGSTISTTGTGTITINGTGSGTGGSSHGIILDNTSSIQGVDGAISLTAAGATSGAGNYGLYLDNTSYIQSTGVATGTIGITATSGGTNNAYGIHLNTASSITSVAGNVTLSATSSGTGTSNNGIYLAAGGYITSTGAASLSITGTGGPGTSASHGIHLDNSYIYTKDGNSTITGTSNGTTTNNYGVVAVGGGKIEVQGTGKLDITGTGKGTNTNYGIYVSGAGSYMLASSSGALNLTGTSTGTGTGNAGALVGVGAYIKSTNTGNISVTGTSSGTSTNYGIFLNNPSYISSTSSGTITLSGTSTATTTGNIGVYFSTTSNISASSGAVSVTGVTAGTDTNTAIKFNSTNNIISATGNITVSATSTATGTGNIGLNMLTNSYIKSTGTATIGITSTVAGSGSSHGTQLTGGSYITSATGDINLTSTTNSTGTNSYGIYATTNSYITSTGAAKLTISGTGGGGTAGNHGIYMDSSYIYANNGNSTIAGTTNGTAATNYGIYLMNTTKFEAQGSGTLGVSGTGKGTDTNYGIFVTGATSYILASSTGALSLTGTSTGTGTGNAGIYLDSSSFVTSSPSTANISVTGSSSGTSGNAGIWLNSANYVSSASSGTITLSGTSTGSTTGNYGINLVGSSYVSGTSGAVSVTGVTAGTDTNTAINLNSSYITTGATVGNNVTISATSTATGTGNIGLNLFKLVPVSYIKSTSTATIGITSTVAGSGSSHGTQLTGASYITSVTGDVTLTSTTNSTGTNNYGIYATTNSYITSTGAAKLTISGTGGGGTTGNHGIYMDASHIYANNGNSTITGTTNGTTTTNYGIYLMNGAKFEAQGSGTLGVSGTGKGTDTNYGIFVTGATSYLLASSSGALSLTGSSTGTGTANAGVYLDASSYVTSNNTANISITGTSSGTSGNAGIWLNSANYVSSTSSGTVTVSGTSTGSTTGNFGINLVGSSYVSSTSSAVSVTGATAGTNTNTAINLSSSNITTGATAGNNLVISATSTATGTGNIGLNLSKVTTASYINSTSTATIGITSTVAGSGTSSGTQLTGGSYITSATGNVSLTSTTNSTGTNNYGIYADTGGYITSTGAATLTISGTGGGGTTGNHGIYMDASYIYAKNGNSTITGTTNGTTTTNYGIYLMNGAKFEAQGLGTLGVSGTGKGTDTNYGIFVTGATSYMKAISTGALSLTGNSTGTGTGNAGVYLDASSYVTSSPSTANISITGTSSGTSGNAGIWLNSANYVSSASSGTITLSGTSTGSTTGNFGINLVGSSYVSSTSSAVSVTGATAGTNTNTAINLSSSNITTGATAGNNLVISGTSTATGTGNIGLNLSKVTTASYINSTSTATIGITSTVAGTGTSSGTQLTGGSYITSATGDITLTSTTNSTGTNNYGIYADTAGLIESSGTAKLTISGTGGGGTTGNHGIYLNDGYIYAENGNSTITGTTNGTTTTNHGIYIAAGGKIEAQGTGTLGITGTGKGTNTNYGIHATGATSYMKATSTGALSLTGNSTGTGTGNAGVYLDASSYVTSSPSTANISITGTSSGTSGNAGIWLNSANYVSSASSGTITLSGTSTGSTTGNYGINLVGSSYVTSASGAVSVTGVTAGTDTNTAINFTSANYVTSASGNITVSATSTATGTGNIGLNMLGTSYINLTGAAATGITIASTVAGTSSNPAIKLDTSSYVKSDTKAIAITGTSNGTGSGNYGIYMLGGSSVQSVTSATIALTGTSGTGSGTNDGININASSITTVAGNVTITGTSRGTNAADDGIDISNAVTIASTGAANISLTGTASTGVGIRTATGANVIGHASDSGAITLTADSMNLADLTLTNTGNIYIVQKTAANTMTFNTAAGSHIIAATVFTGMTTSGSLYIGDAATGAMTVSSAYSYQRPVIFDTNNATITVSAIQNTVAASKGSFLFMDPAVVSANIDTSDATGGTPSIQFDKTLSLSADLKTSNGTTTNGNITITGNLTLPGTGATRLLTTGTGHIYIGTTPATTITANTDTLTFSGTGKLYLGSAFTSTNTPLDVNRDMELTGNSSIETGTAAISLKNVTMGAYTLGFGTGTGGVNLNGTITSTSNNNIDFVNRNLNLTGNSSISNGTGLISLRDVAMGANDFTLVGTGALYLNGDITSTNKNFTINRSTTVKGDSSIALGTGIFTLSNPLDMGTNAGDSNNTFDFDVNSAGTININADITSRGKSDGSKGILLKSSGSILVGSAADIKSDTEDFNITLWANSAGTGGAIQVAGTSGAALSILDSKGGSITLGGGNGGSASAGNAVGNITNTYGVELSYAQLTTAGGNVIVNGQGYAAAAANHSVYVRNGSTISTTGAGTVSINATSAGGGNTGDGIRVDGSTISYVNGNVTLTGAAGAGGGDGVRLANTTALTSTGSGVTTITGTTTSGVGIKVDTGANTIGGGSATGNIKIIADTMNLANLAMTSTGNAYIENNTAIAMEMSTGATSHQIAAAVISGSSLGDLYIGSATATSLKVSSSYTFASPTIFNTNNGNITISASQSTAAASKGSFKFMDPAIVTAALNTSAATTGTQDIVFDGTLSLSANLTSGNGPITVTGAMTLPAAAVTRTLSSGSGNISLSDVTANDNTLAFAGTGILNLGGAFVSTDTPLDVNRNMILTANSSIETGTAAISLKNITMGAYTLGFGTGTGGVNLNGAITSTNKAINLGNRDLTLTGNSSFDTGTGTISLNNVAMSTYTLNFLTGVGDVNLNGNITSTNAALTFGTDKKLVLAKNSTINTGTGAITLGDVAMSTYTLTFGGTGDLNLNGDITSTDVDLSFGSRVVKLTGNSTIETGTGVITLGDVAMSSFTLGFGTGTGRVDLGGDITSINAAIDFGNRPLTLTANSSISTGTGDITVKDIAMGTNTFTMAGAGDLNLDGEIKSTNIALTINRDTYMLGDSSVDLGSGLFTLSNPLAAGDYAFDVLNAGNIIVNADITSKGKADGSRSMTLGSKSRIEINNGASIKSIQDELKIVLHADNDNNGTCSIKIAGAGFGTESVLHSEGGDIVIGGGLDPLNNPAIGDAASPYGVELFHAKLVAKGGNISIRGVGFADGGLANHGVYINSKSTVSTTGAGTILINGGGVTGGTIGDGVHIDDSTLTFVNGNMTLTGVGGDAGGEGVRITNGATIVPTGSSDVTITGSSPTSIGIKTDTGANVIGGGSATGDISLIADTMDLSNLAITTSGDVYIKQKTAANTMDIATAATSHVISGAAMSAISAGNLYFGDAATGILTVASSYSFASPAIFNTNNVNIVISAALSTVAASTGSLEFMDPVVLTADLDTSAATSGTQQIKFNSSLTLPVAGITRTLTSDAGDIYLADVTANNNELVFAGAGGGEKLYLGGNFVNTNKALNINRELELTADSSINTGTGQLDALKIVGVGNKLTIDGSGTFNLNGDITSTNTEVTINREITLGSAVTLDNGNGNLWLSGITAGANNLTIGGTGNLYLKGNYTSTQPLSFNRIITLKAITSIDNGAQDIDVTQDINLDVFDLYLGNGGKLNLSANFNSVSGSLDLEKELNINGATVFTMGSGNLTIADVVMGANDLEFSGTGNLTMKGDITGTSGKLTFDMPTYLTQATKINTGSGDILFKQTLDNDYDLEFDTTGTITFMEDVGVGQTLGIVSFFNASTIDVQKQFISRGFVGYTPPPPPSSGGAYVPMPIISPSLTVDSSINNRVSINMPSQIGQSSVTVLFMEFYLRIMESRLHAIANTNNLGSTEKVFATNPINTPYGLIKTPFINSLPDLSQKRKSFQPKTKKAK